MLPLLVVYYIPLHKPWYIYQSDIYSMYINHYATCRSNCGYNVFVWLARFIINNDVFTDNLMEVAGISEKFKDEYYHC